MILATLRAAGLAALTITTMAGCNNTSVSNLDSNQGSDEQSSAGGGGSGNDNASGANASNTAPQASALCVATPGSATGYDGSLADQISDKEDRQFNFSIVQQPANGSLQLDLATGDFNYSPTTPSRGYTDSFSYRVDDLNGGSAVGTVDLVYGALRVMPLGNSITYGVTGYTSATGDQPSQEFAVGYRQALYEALVGEGYMVDFVGNQSAGAGSGLADPDHQGLPGWTSWRIGDAVNGWLSSNPADVVLAHIGTNDHQITTDGVNHVLNNINNWSVNNNSVKMLLATIVDQRPDTFFEDTVEDFNANLTQLVQDSWPEVELVDQYSALDNETDLTPLSQDSVGLHPTTGGYQKMAAVWLDALHNSGQLNKCP
ncbi:MAG: Ig-like domain-containing protein [Granulosicoccaceae bacterium]